jgi:hypothetical protein
MAVHAGIGGMKFVRSSQVAMDKSSRQIVAVVEGLPVPTIPESSNFHVAAVLTVVDAGTDDDVQAKQYYFSVAKQYTHVHPTEVDYHWPFSTLHLPLAYIPAVSF